MAAMMTTKEEAVRRLNGASRKLASFGVVSIGLFGSFVTGLQTPTSYRHRIE